MAPRYLFTARVLPSSESKDPRIAWRLVGGNNHELGRSAASFSDLDECTAAVHALQDRLRDAESDVFESGGQWGWVLRVDDVDVAVSCRWYRRVRESQYNLIQFLAVAPTATLSHVVAGPPPRRDLLRPEFVLPHLPFVQDDFHEVVTELSDQVADESAVADSGEAAAS